jgi:carboxyl-terminal processing protease
MRLLVFACALALICLGNLTTRAVAQPPDTREPGAASGPKLPVSDVYRLLSLFGDIFERTRQDYVEKPDEKKLVWAAIDGMLASLPSVQRAAVAESIRALRSRPRLGTDVYAALSEFGDAFETLRRQTPDGDAALIEGAITNMLASLDPNSTYMDAKTFRELQGQGRGDVGGIGLEITMDQGRIKVVRAIEETPAARSGIRPNDSITHFDEEPALGFSLAQAVAKLRGPINSSIKLKIAREGVSRPIDLAVTREVIRVRAVRWRLEGNDIGVIRVSQFNEQATAGLKNAISELTNQSGGRLKAFAVDLRGNPGGLLDQAISFCDALLERGEIVTTHARKPEETQRFNARPGDLTNGKPIAVLVNNGSAAASEIVAGALQDNKRAIIIGTATFGRGSVQTIIPLGAGKGALRLTTARFVTPSGRSIEGTGISPDIEVQDGGPQDDRALPRAVDFLRGLQPQ